MAKFSFNARESASRVAESTAPILQIILAAVAAYSIGLYLLHHETPLLAVTVTITSLGFTRDARPRRVLETAFGMVVGVVLSEVLGLAFGHGVWQLAVILALSLTIARFISGSAAFALTAGIQSVLVQVLVIQGEANFSRSLDALVGAATALLVTALIPRDPRRLARIDANKLFEVFLEAVDHLRTATRDVNVEVADETLKDIRRTQPLVDNWRMSLDSAIAISRISPFLRKHRGELRGQLRLMRGMDLATRNLRVVVRRIDFLLRDGQSRPYLADLFEQIFEATSTLAAGLEEPDRLLEAQAMFVEITHQLDPKKFGIADQVREASVLLLLRPMLVDLMCAAGLSEDAARDELPEI